MRVDRDEFGFLGNYTPLEYRTGLLAESWEQPDPTTVIIHLRQGVVWKGGPAEGREFTSDDIVYTYDKVLGVGEFAGEDPNSVFAAVIPSVAEAVATDRYTVWFHLSSTGLFTIDEVLNPWMSIPIVPREWYEDLTEEEQADWRNVTGTGPFIIEDYADGTSLTYVANPDYYGVDARYPVNKLPYADELKILVVPDMDTALAALRTGQIDLLADTRDYPTLAETQQLVQTNPEINVFHQPVAAPGLFFAWDTEAGTILPPFDDINIRIAMQLAINNALIAETYYMGTVDGTLYGLMSPLVGEDWANPLDEWPAELQAEYGYDLEAAKALMAEAGVSTPFHTEILASTSEDIELLQILQAQFQEIGIDMEIVPMTMMEQRPLVQQGDFELLWTGATGSASNSPSNAIQSFYEGKFEAIGQGARANDSYYNELVEDFLAATTMSEAQAIFREADQYWLEQHWMVIGFPSWSNQFAQPWIKGYMGEHFWCTMTWTYFAHMWIDQDLKTSLGH
jgi:peptide/nickel transport system substrate-binding protein